MYSYTLLTLAWGLDQDTHSHFRKYLDIFIKKREVLKDFKSLVNDPKVRVYLNEWYLHQKREVFNELRVSLPKRVIGSAAQGNIGSYNFDHLSIPHLIEDIHPVRPPFVSLETFFAAHHEQLEWTAVVPRASGELARVLYSGSDSDSD
jgi:hypothetical protein